MFRILCSFQIRCYRGGGGRGLANKVVGNLIGDGDLMLSPGGHRNQSDVEFNKESKYGPETNILGNRLKDKDRTHNFA